MKTSAFTVAALSCLFFKSSAFPVSRASSKTNEGKYEKQQYQNGYEYVIGTDDVGRGAIAGPILSASCCIHKDALENNLLDHVNDSKILSAQDRQEIFDQILESDIYFRCAERSPQQIDDSNIQKATMECFQESIQKLILEEELPLEKVYAVCDGKSTPKLVGSATPIPCRPMVDADQKIYTVSLASIIAKVTRDKLMCEAHEQWPEYNFKDNKGYRTREHVEAIHKYGPCPIHRMSFKALKHR